MPEKDKKSGRVFLVGAGPGDPDLITVKGYSILNSCDAVVYDNLIPHELIFTLPANIEKIYVGKVADAHTLPQEQINKLMVKLAEEGKNVVRLKGGDPFVFGRGGEEAEYLREHKIEFEVIPGITAGLAGAASAGIPASHRDMSSAILLITAHGSSENDFFMDWEWVSAINNGTIIGYMGVRKLSNVVQNLIDNGLPSDTEAALVERCCFSTQKIVRAKLSDLPDKAKEAGIKPPAIFIIGEVAMLADKLDWFDRKPLSGIRVMVTRPADQSRWIYQMLRGMGAEVLAYPTIKTTFVNDKEGWEEFTKVSEGNQWLFFSSENSVRYFFGYLKSKQIDLRSVARYKIAAAGTGTLRTLNTLGYFPDYSPPVSGMVAFTEKMCEDLEVENAHVIRIKGYLANDPVMNILERGGAEVKPLCVYKTETAAWEENETHRLFVYPPSLIMFSSGRSVDGLVEILGEDKARQLASGAKIASIGPMTTAEAKKYDINVDIEASRHSIPDLINQIIAYYGKS